MLVCIPSKQNLVQQLEGCAYFFFGGGGENPVGKRPIFMNNLWNTNK